MQKNLLIILLTITLIFSSPPAFAQDSSASVDVNTDISISDVSLNDENETDINTASEEDTKTTTETGTLIEIGNTTAEQTTIIVRTTDENGNTEDQTLEIDTATSLQTDTRTRADLSDWIAGDQITFTAKKFINSGALLAERIRNRSFKRDHVGRNGWITAIHVDEQKVDVEWAGTVYTLDISETRMVAGLKNPATIHDLKVGDRVRARVVNDSDDSRLTWDAKILVVLRRGDTLFMRVTRWVMPGVITSIPEELDLPTTIEVEVSESKFYEKGDVNNLIGAPGTKMMVDITEDTNLRRRYLGKALLSEFSEGDKVRIIGRRDESNGHLVARYMQNISIQRLGVAHRLGKITEINTENKSFNAELLHTRREHKQWTVNTDTETQFYKRGQDEFGFSDLTVGDIVRVRGTASRTTKSVNADMVSVLFHKRLKPNTTPELIRPLKLDTQLELNS